jgi:methyl-galactoside transport system substrate-binding protein
MPSISFLITVHNKIIINVRQIFNKERPINDVIKAFQKCDYNKRDNTPTIPVVGVNAMPGAREPINQGVIQYPSYVTKILYIAEINYVYNKSLLHDTKCKFNKTGSSILPFIKNI